MRCSETLVPKLLLGNALVPEAHASDHDTSRKVGVREGSARRQAQGMVRGAHPTPN